MGLTERGRSSVVEHNLAKVGVESSNLFARSRFPLCFRKLSTLPARHADFQLFGADAIIGAVCSAPCAACNGRRWVG